jgi:hypothetical protein
MEGFFAKELRTRVGTPDLRERSELSRASNPKVVFKEPDISHGYLFDSFSSLAVGTMM